MGEYFYRPNPNVARALNAAYRV